MELGGNAPWREFFDTHPVNVAAGRGFEECTIAERYEGPVGEEWKGRLTAKVEGKEYVAPDPPPPPQKSRLSGERQEVISGRSTPSLPSSSSRVSVTPQRSASPGQKGRNEAFFARMGEANAARPDNLAPSQGGKYSGFGSTPSPSTSTSGSGLDDFQRDPVAALSKGFSWLSTTVSHHAANVNKTYIRPGMRSLQEGDLAAQAQRWGGAAQEQFQKFVDPDHHSTVPSQQQQRRNMKGTVEPEKKDFWDSFGRDPTGPPKEKKGFWDEFAQVGEARMQQTRQPGVAGKGTTSIGTSAMKTGGGVGKKEEGGGGGDSWGDW